MANIKGGAKDTKYRLVISGAYPQKGKNANGVEMTGYNIAFRMANDRMTKADITAGKAQTAPMLAYDSYTDKNGEKQTSFTRPYSKEQYESIMAAANTKGDKPVIEACVFPRNNGLVVNTNTLSTPKYKYDKAKDAENTNKAREVAAAQREAREQQAEAQTEQQAQADSPEFE